MGTAGHIDHGKTALIKALTGVDCDTHKEEKARGITINLGFAHQDLPTGDSIGIVDVPGHHDFVHTMVGGASGIDFALLVVAADAGVMAQTREHLQIMDVLGVRSGLIAVTKIDLVEPEIADIAVDEVTELVEGTFLEGRPVVRVSSVTGQGLNRLTTAIADVAGALEDRPAGEVFRLFVDRIFTVRGFGTVVTGSVTSGTLRVGDTSYLLPGDKELRVRRLERHGKETDQARAGDRASINLVGLNRQDFHRGMIISDRLLRSTTMLDGKLRLFQYGKSLDLWNRAIFHLGTYEQQARVHLIESNQLTGGQTGLVQIHLDAPCVVQFGDRFVIRSTSNDVTIGGGEVIDAAPLHHRRRPEKLIRNMARIADGRVPELIAAEVRKHFRPIGHKEIADLLNISANVVRETVTCSLSEEVVRYDSGGEIYLIAKSEHDRLREACLKSITSFHRWHPLEQRGRTVEELMGIVGMAQEPASKAMLRLMLAGLEQEGKLKRVDGSWALADHTLKIGPELDRKVKFVAGFLRTCGVHTPLTSELTRSAGKQGIDERELKQILQYLIRKQQVYLIEENYLHASVVDRCRQSLLTALAGRPEGMTVAQFRDLVKGNRRICLLLFAIYDGEGITRRDGDLRVLTDKGRRALES